MNQIKKSQIDKSCSQIEQKIYWNNSANLEIEEVKKVFREKSLKKLEENWEK